MRKVEDISKDYYNGQQAFEREDIRSLLRKIDSLEVANKVLAEKAWRYDELSK